MKGVFTVPDTIFESLFTGTSAVLDIGTFLLSFGSALVLGFITALFYTYRSEYSRSFVMALAMLPAIVAVIIMMVSGSLGAGVAVAGAFSLVRFRSAPGTAKEICAVFLAMAAGLACGMGYPLFGAVFTVIMGIVSVICTALKFGEKKGAELRRTVNVTVPEDLDHEKIFDDIMERYSSEWKLIRVKTTNLGSLIRLTYEVVFRESGTEKQMIDELRTRNGNLEISVVRTASDPQNEL